MEAGIFRFFSHVCLDKWMCVCVHEREEQKLLEVDLKKLVLHLLHLRLNSMINFANITWNFCTGFNETYTFIWKSKAVATTFNEFFFFFNVRILRWKFKTCCSSCQACASLATSWSDCVLQLDLIDGIYLQQAPLMPNLSGWSTVGKNRDLETSQGVVCPGCCHEVWLFWRLKAIYMEQVSTKLTTVPFIRSIIHLEAIFTLKWHLLHNK